MADFTPPGAPTSPNAPPPPNVRRGSPTRLILIVVGLLVVVLVGVAVVAGDRGETAVRVETADAQVRAITRTVTASGKVRPEVEVPISSEVSGEIVFLAVAEGDRVQEGQLLIRMRGDLYTAQREQARAGLLQAQADVARARAERLQAEADVRRQEGLLARNAVAEAEVEAARTRLSVAEAGYEAAEFRVRSAEATLDQAADQLRRTSLYAPISGTVSMLNVELGQRVVGTAQMAGTELMRIAELERMEIEVDINENDVVHISIGDSARVEVDAYPNRPLRGSVTQIANSARTSGMGTQDQVTSFPVKIRLATPASASDTSLVLARGDELQAPMPVLRPGMSGTADVFTRTVAGAVVVPIQAVTVRDFNALDESSDPYAREDLRRVVFVVEDGRTRMVEVETGISDDTHIEVTRGLTGGETVVSGPFRILRTELRADQAVEVRG